MSRLIPDPIYDPAICYLCGSTLVRYKSWQLRSLPDNAYTVDHIQPISRGGTDSPKNLAPCCNKCNRSKDNLVRGHQWALEFMSDCMTLLIPMRIITSRTFKAPKHCARVGKS